MPRSKIKATDEVIDEELKKATKKKTTSKKKDDDDVKVVKKTTTRKSTTKSTAKSTSKVTKKDSSETKAKSTSVSKSKKADELVEPVEEKKKTTRKTSTKKTTNSKKALPVDEKIDTSKAIEDSENSSVEEKPVKKTTRKSTTKKSDDTTKPTVKKTTTTTKTRSKKADKEEPVSENIIDSEIVEEKPVKKTTKKSTAKKDDSTKSTTKRATTKKSTSTTKKSTTSKTSAQKTTARKSSVPKKVVSSKSVEVDLENDELIEDKFENIVEYYDLPYRYNQTVVKLLAQNPTTLFVYWDVSDEDIENFKKLYGDNFFNITKPVLLVHNLTHNYTFEIEINDFANNWYIHVNDSKCSYSVELCRRIIENQNDYDSHYIENLVNVSYSNTIEIPNDHILFFKENDKIYFKNIKTNRVTEMVYKSASQGNDLKAIYSDYELSQDEDRFDFKNPSSQNPTSNVM